MTPPPTQATVHDFNAANGAGSIITDAGLVIPFPASAWRAGPLLTMRQGQRVRVTLAGSGSDVAVTSLTLVTFPPQP